MKARCACSRPPRFRGPVQYALVMASLADALSTMRAYGCVGSETGANGAVVMQALTTASSLFIMAWNSEPRSPSTWRSVIVTPSSEDARRVSKASARPACHSQTSPPGLGDAPALWTNPCSRKRTRAPSRTRSDPAGLALPAYGAARMIVEP